MGKNNQPQNKPVEQPQVAADPVQAPAAEVAAEATDNAPETTETAEKKEPDTDTVAADPVQAPAAEVAAEATDNAPETTETAEKKEPDTDTVAAATAEQAPEAEDAVTGPTPFDIRAAKYLKQYPNAEALHFTKDGQVFQNLNLAKLHQASIDRDRPVVTIKRK